MTIPCPICGADSSVRRGNARPAIFRLCNNGHRFAAPVGPMCECGNLKGKRAVACSRCLDLERQRVKISDGHKRVVNALYSFDWCTGADLWEAMSVTGGSEGVAVSSTLANLVKSGEVEKRRDVFGRLEYRLVRKQRRAA